jgi:ATP-dependent protease Clp ATPase subunit
VAAFWRAVWCRLLVFRSLLLLLLLARKSVLAGGSTPVTGAQLCRCKAMLAIARDACISRPARPQVSTDETERLVNMESVLHNRVIGQEEAVVAISRAIRRARVGLKNPNRPIASFIFSGPTGVGKSELAKTLATYYFGNEARPFAFSLCCLSAMGRAECSADTPAFR